MNEIEFERRKERAGDEVFVIATTEGGFRVYSPVNINRIFMVTGIPDSPQCNCGDFEAKRSDPKWRCKHILTVLNQSEKRQDPKPATESSDQTQQKESEPTPSDPVEKKKSKTPRNGRQALMTVKRSVSPDG